MTTIREVASQNEIDLLLEEGLLEERHLDEPILGEQDTTRETYYRLSDVVVVIRDQTEPTAILLPSKLEIVFDNGGGVTIQSPGFAHYYDDAAQAARDVRAYLDSESTDDWDGDDMAAYVDSDHAAYRVLSIEDVQNAKAAGEIETTWGNVRAFMRALGVRVID